MLRSFPEGNSRSTQSSCLEKTLGALLGVRGNCGSMKLCTDMNLKPRLSMTKRLSPLCTLKSLSTSTGTADIPHFLILLYKKIQICLKYCASKSCVFAKIPSTLRVTIVSRADKAVHVAEEALGDERQATSLLWAFFLQSTRLAQGTTLAA